jgi:membrane protein DedA with SNARE-associated domain
MMFMNWLLMTRLWLLHKLSYVVASLIPLQILQQTLGRFGYPAVTLFVMIESAGIPFPGETMLLLASFYASLDPHLNVVIVIACAAMGAILGDNFGYYVGRVGGHPFVNRFGRYFFIKPHHLNYAERFFVRHGGKTVFFGRFVTILRIWAAFLAGMHHMHWRTFLVYNAAGGILWAAIYGTLGYVAGRVFHDNFTEIERLANTLGWVTGGSILAIVVIAILFIRWRFKRRFTRKWMLSDQDQDTTP